MDEILGRIEQQKEDAHYLKIDGRPHPGCPECGSSEISDRDAQARDRSGQDGKPPFRMVCEDCGAEWAEDEDFHLVDDDE